MKFDRIFYICPESHFFISIRYAPGHVVKRGRHFLPKTEIQFKAHFRPVNEKDDKLYQKHFRVKIHRIFKQGRENVRTMPRVGAFRNY